jgi:GMP synthase (glutamine-hydrolysing)
VLQHSPLAPLGLLQPVLSAGAALVTVDLTQGTPEVEMESAASVEALIRDESYGGLIALGGPMGVYERREYASLDHSLLLMSDAVRRGVPILGFGLGSQLLAEALGSPVFMGSKRGLPLEMGFLPLFVTKAGAYDPVMRIFAAPEPQFFWHRDTHDVPPEALHLASTAVYSMAAFRWGRWAYGLQFHPEATTDMVERWIEEEAERLDAHDVDPLRLVAQAKMLEGSLREKAGRLGELFLGWIAEAHPRS